MSTIKVQVGSEAVFVEAEYLEARAAVKRALVGSHVLSTGVPVDAPVIALADLTAWAKAAQRRHDEPQVLTLAEAA